MKYRTYDLNLSMAGTNQFSSEGATSFNMSISNSIYNLLPYGSVSFKDVTGVVYEKLQFTQGISVKSSFKNEPCKNTASLDAIAGLITMNSYDGSGVIRGTFDIDLVHPAFVKQEPSSKAYRGAVSNIIQEVSKGLFTATNVGLPSDGILTFYQAGKSSLDFIEQDLKSKLYSRVSNDTPYYVWVGFDNKLNIKHRKELLEQSPLHTLFLENIHKQKSLFNHVINLEVLTPRMEQSRDSFSKSDTRIDLKTGEPVNFSRTCLNNNPSPSRRHLSMFKSSYGTNREKIKAPKNSAEEYILKGSQINSQKVLCAMQRLVLTINLNTDIEVGHRIILQSKSYKMDGSLSPMISGKTSPESKTPSRVWIVDSVNHRHLGLQENPMVTTTLVISSDSFEPSLSDSYGLLEYLGRYE